MFIIKAIIQQFKGVPWFLLLCIYAIVAFGLLNIYSATSASISPNRFYDHLTYIAVGTGSMLFWGVVLDTKKIEGFAWPLYLSICILLLLVYFMGTTVNGSKRWLSLAGGIRLQPSEFCKFVIIVVTAKAFSGLRTHQVTGLFSAWKPVAIVSIPTLLIFFQPDFGTSGLVFLIAFIQMCFVVRIRIRTLALIAVSALPAILVFWNFVLKDYQRARVLSFLNPALDPQGQGYQVIQSLIAVGGGGFWGQGFQQGSQSQLSFLPERHTDFAFSVLSEEHGFIGVLFLFILYSLMIFFSAQLAEKARDTFSGLLAVGVCAFFCLHFFINTMMVLALFPVVGAPLTFISYGGSHMLTALSCVGLLVAVGRKRFEVMGRNF